MDKDNMTFRTICCCLIVLGLFSCRSANTIKPEAKDTYDPFSALVNFYRGPLNHLSAVRMGECPMHPSDSEYSLQALNRHGMIVGWIMSVDRLMRCGRDETKLAPKVLVNGKWRTYDPVENNDFWWKD